MYNIEVYKTDGPKAKIVNLEVSRDWMSENQWAYNCYPVTLVNKFGFGISFPEDISFIWNGSTAPGPDSGIKILKGEEYCYFGRGGGVIGFPTDLIFKTDENVSLLTIPVPNQFIDGLQAFSSLLTTSFYTGSFNAVCKVTSPNKEITIKAGTPIVAVLPISLGEINNSSITIKTESIPNRIHGDEYASELKKYGEINKRPAMWFQKAVDQFGRTIGKHEVSSIKLKVNKEND